MQKLICSLEQYIMKAWAIGNAGKSSNIPESFWIYNFLISLRWLYFYMNSHNKKIKLPIDGNTVLVYNHDRNRFELRKKRSADLSKERNWLDKLERTLVEGDGKNDIKISGG